MPPWSIHNKWCIRLRCSADVCREANYIVDSALAHDLGRRRIIDSDVMVKKVFHGVSHDFLRKFSDVEKAFERKIELIMINYRLRMDECLRKAFYMHHALDVMLNTLIPINNVFGGVRRVEELVNSALKYLDLIYRTISASASEPKDGFILNYDKIKREIRETLLLYKHELVSGVDEHAWIKRIEKRIRRKISNACKLTALVKPSSKYLEAAKRQWYKPGIPSDLAERCAIGQWINWVSGIYRGKLVDKLMVCSGLYHYTLLNSWDEDNPFFILKNARRVLSELLIDLWSGIDFDIAVNYAFRRYPFNKYPYPEEIMKNLKKLLSKLFSTAQVS